MIEIYAAIEQIEDKTIKEALTTIADELKRIREVRPVTNTLAEVAYAVNKITGSL